MERRGFLRWFALLLKELETYPLGPDERENKTRIAPNKRKQPMKKQTTKSNSGALPHIIKATFTPGLLSALVLLFSTQASRAGSATWNLNPTSADWNTAANWTPATVPNGPADTATFGVSNITGISTLNYFYPGTEVNGIVFDLGASAYTITTSGGFAFTLSGVGITNNSGSLQNFAAGAFLSNTGFILFGNNATAGSLTAFTNLGGNCDTGGPASTQFFDTSSAGNGTFTNNGSECSENIGGYTSFFDTSSAANGTFTNNGGEDCTSHSLCGGQTRFDQTSTAGNATLIANGSDVGGAIFFWSDSTGGTARVEVFDNGNLDISLHNPPGVTVGSIEGTGNVFLGANNLAVGSNNLSTTFSGVIQDFGAGGSFTKIGTGTLTLTGANTYTGDTTVNGGELVVNNMSGSGTSSGAVQVNAGTLGGAGTIAGPVTMGTGNGTGAVLAPGKSQDKAGTLRIQSALTFNSDATYKFELKTKRAIADKVIANGVTISGARVSFVSCGDSALPPGTVFTVIDNTAATPIAGTFSNLADDSTLVADGNTFQVSYEGGTGNDLTLTVQ
jgi:autotransporter-associated beta strand protein